MGNGGACAQQNAAGGVQFWGGAGGCWLARNQAVAAGGGMHAQASCMLGGSGAIGSVYLYWQSECALSMFCRWCKCYLKAHGCAIKAAAK
jgi:hypothetical protein